MAKLHWSVYIIAGLIVSIASWRINYEKLVFFFYAGLAFVLIGIVKLAFWLVKMKLDSKPVQHSMHRHQAYQHGIKHCSRCGTPLRANQNFCIKCRARAL